MARKQVVKIRLMEEDDLWVAAKIEVRAMNESWNDISNSDCEFFHEALRQMANNAELESLYTGILECEMDNYNSR